MPVAELGLVRKEAGNGFAEFRSEMRKVRLIDGIDQNPAGFPVQHIDVVPVRPGVAGQKTDEEFPFTLRRTPNKTAVFHYHQRLPEERRRLERAGRSHREPDQRHTLLADEFVAGKSDYRGIHLTYAAFQPEKNGKKRPLLIWLHGAGEGGTDPIVAVSGNKVTNLISDGIQRLFGGCYVLGPQSPTVWMDDGTGKIGTNGSSIYVESLKNLIDEYIAAHDDIDRRRVCIGGCSNGGFMTLKMILAYPQMFAAAFPICEALADACVTDEDIGRIRDIPIWFVHAENDPIVDVNRYARATYQRLLGA